jgi:hypothetical protein
MGCTHWQSRPARRARPRDKTRKKQSRPADRVISGARTQELRSVVARIVSASPCPPSCGGSKTGGRNGAYQLATCSGGHTGGARYGGASPPFRSDLSCEIQRPTYPKCRLAPERLEPNQPRQNRPAHRPQQIAEQDVSCFRSFQGFGARAAEPKANQAATRKACSPS